MNFVGLGRINRINVNKAFSCLDEIDTFTHANFVICCFLHYLFKKIYYHARKKAKNFSYKAPAAK